MNAAIMGAATVGAYYVRRSLADMKALAAEATSARESCRSLTATIAEAHNGYAKRLLEVEDKLKAAQLRANPKPFGFKQV